MAGIKIKLREDWKAGNGLPLGAALEIEFDGTDIEKAISEIRIEPIVYDKPVIVHLTFAATTFELDSEVITVIENASNTYHQADDGTIDGGFTETL